MTSSASLLSFEERSSNKRSYTTHLAVSFIILFTVAAGGLIKLLFDISQEIAAIRENTYLMCSVLPMKSGTCIGSS